MLIRDWLLFFKENTTFRLDHLTFLLTYEKAPNWAAYFIGKEAFFDYIFSLVKILSNQFKIRQNNNIHFLMGCSEKNTTLPFGYYYQKHIIWTWSLENIRQIQTKGHSIILWKCQCYKRQRKTTELFWIKGD